MTTLALFGLGPGELLIILAIVLLLFGGSRLAGLGKSTGRALKEFKEETRTLRGPEAGQAPADPYGEAAPGQGTPYGQSNPYGQQAPGAPVDPGFAGGPVPPAASPYPQQGPAAGGSPARPGSTGSSGTGSSSIGQPADGDLRRDG